MRKSLFAAAILATLGAISAAPASAAPGMIGAVDAPTAVTFTVTAVLGSLAASRLAPRLPGNHLRRWFAYLVLAVAIYVTTQATHSLIS